MFDINYDPNQPLPKLPPWEFEQDPLRNPGAKQRLQTYVDQIIRRIETIKQRIPSAASRSKQIRVENVEDECNLNDIEDDVDFLSSRYAEYSGLPANRMNVNRADEKDGRKNNQESINDFETFIPALDENIKVREMRCFTVGRYDFG